MDVNDRKTQRRSSAAPSHSPSHSHLHSHPQSQPRGAVYHSETTPSTRSASSKRCPSNQSDRPQHPSLNRVKGRANMNTPPRMSPEMSWLSDQSPVRGTRTPPRPCKASEPGTPTTLVNPASSLLQDLLKEQRAHRGSRGAGSEEWNDSRPRTPENRSAQEDTASEKSRKMKDTFTASSREQPKEMGVREMDQYVSKITKLNFDLKLEIFHRTQQLGTMEKKMERMEEMEEELQQMHKLEEEVVELRVAKKQNHSLQESNDRLREELHKRDQAVAEAVQFICQLEAKIDEIESGGRTSQASFNRLVLDGPNATPRTQTALEIPERTSSKRASLKSPERTLNKVPSFMRGDGESTSVLRSLYAPEVNKSYSAMSQLTKSESYNTMNDILEPGSPRLSVLSECSELHPLDTPTKWDQADKLDIPVRKVSSMDSFDSFNPRLEREERMDSQIDEWMEPRQDMQQTIIRRRMNRVTSDASKIPTAPFRISSNHQGRGRLDESLFVGVKLPPTPDTMSTAHVAGRNGSNGSMAAAAQRSPRPERDLWLAGRPLERHRSADELTTRTRHSYTGSDITDSMQTNCSDTPRLGFMNDKESPSMFPFNTVASKASELLGPGSPNNPVVDSFGGLLRQNSNGSQDEAVPPAIPVYRTPTKTVSKSRSMEDEASPPLTPQEWIAAARHAPRSRKELAHGLRAAFHDGDSVDSYPMEHDAPGVPTLDMDTLNILEQPIAEVPEDPVPQQKSEPEQRRRFSFRPPFLNRANLPRRLQPSQTVPDLMDDDEEDGAPSPIIPKTRNVGGAGRRPMSQIIANSTDYYSSSVPASNERFGNENFTVKSFHQSLMESRDENLPPIQNGSATISGRPTTSHSADHKRRSSLGIFGWMKGMSAKRSEPATPADAEDFPESVKDSRPVSRLTHETSRLTLGRPSTPDSMDAPVVRPRSEMTMYSDDQTRRPRYMGRRARRG
ncbi:hypothetical protein N7481_005509 [Penicillium waksmanii]|uniref:uncharacterized protein n=1 Tax=Penicillium waksmanii TaxID=69791 RepID=UPI00254902EF|nr:uncharacterized protein N7481_005509 [Penicillium waksmanii]KAJ5983410.1 hypothetical protein N7481_005509 [Penicillium waksmanii]